MPSTTFAVAGMCCADEVAAVERALRPDPTVINIVTNLMAGSVVVEHTEQFKADVAIRAIAREGLRAEQQRIRSAPVAAVHRGRAAATIVSGVCTIVGVAMEWWGADIPLLQIGLFCVAVVTGAWYVVPKAVRALMAVSLDMNVLMSAAVLGAMAIGEWSEAATVAWLFALSELLESISVGRARRAIHALMDVAPRTATVRVDGALVDVDVDAVSIGATVIVRSAMKVPLDGTVIHGTSAVNEAAITGESMPVQKDVGDHVLAGSVNTDGMLEIRVTSIASQSTVARIVDSVTAAQAQRSPTQRFVDSFARIYTPITFLVAVAVLVIPPLLFGAAWDVWIYRSLVLLVIACPCALVISTPVAIVSGLTAMARRGVLVKGGQYLEEIGRLRAIALDKTGTITTGTPSVTQVIPWNGFDAVDVIEIAACIDVYSTHPVARAIVAYAHAHVGAHVTLAPTTDYRALTGRGAEATVNGHRSIVGNTRMMRDAGLLSPELEHACTSIESTGASAIVVGRLQAQAEGGKVVGIIAVADTIREHAREAIEAMRAAGIRSVVMLSGDNQHTVDHIGALAGVDAAYGDLLPDDKVDHIRTLVSIHHHVGMVGDGVNDAPAMATANVGIVMGRIGTDAAIETADIALVHDDLFGVAHTIRLGRRTLRTIRTNIAVALLVKAVFLVLAIGGMATLWMAIVADTGTTLVVIMISLRLLQPRSPSSFPSPHTGGLPRSPTS
jgi:Cd2+/Zn2+-exporting ATPase